ncbi:MAG: AAA family ATPase, partial [Mesoflavibacter sp.]|nr:AAA family ATPase [Mesoflavibacter sp.]
MKRNQLLGLLLGPPGAGKTYSIKELGKIMKWKIQFTATTHTAKAELDGGRTINDVCQLGQNFCNFNNVAPNSKQITKIRNALQDVSLLVIDEVSMLTPVMLAKIDWHLKCAFDKNYAFGGKDVVLVGDFWQFPPVTKKYKNKMALYQAAVRTERGFSAPNTNYTKGAKLFLLFKLVKLKGQQRADDEYNDWLTQIRNYNKKYPITREWLKRISVLKPDDMKDKKIDWASAPTIVSGNYERRKIIEHKMMLLGQRWQQPILRWINKVSTGRSEKDKRCCDFQLPSFDPENLYPELVKYFVRGAECTFTQEFYGFPKGTRAKYIGVAWKDKKIHQNINYFEPGIIHNVTVPDYLIVEIIPKKKKKDKNKKKPKNPTIVPLEVMTTRFEDKNGPEKKNITFQEHPCELSISRTYHKTQGATYKSVILSLNSISPNATKIKKLEITSLYVGASRVHNFNELRMLPLSEQEIKALTKLTIDPQLRTYFKNYDIKGNWKIGGLKKDDELRKQQAKSELGMIKWNCLNVVDLEKFAKKLDLEIKQPKKREQYEERLRNIHKYARDKLKDNHGIPLKQKRIIFIKKLLKEDLRKMNADKMRYYAKRLGHDRPGQQKRTLLPYLEKIITDVKNETNIYDNDSNNDTNTDSNNYSDNDNDNDIHMLSSQKTEYSEQYGADSDENDEKGGELVWKATNIGDKDIVIPLIPENLQKTYTGKIFYQTDWYDTWQLEHIQAKNLKVKMLFGDNDQDYFRNNYQKRQNFGGQAKIMGNYDRKYAFGIVTTFYNSNPPHIDNFKILIDKQFKQLSNFLSQGYDIVIPTPDKKQIRKNIDKFCYKGQQVIYHNLGTGIAKLPFKYLMYIQQKIDQLEKYLKCKKIEVIQCYGNDDDIYYINNN